MERFKWIAGDALLRMAQLCATSGRRLLGTPRTKLSGDHAAGARELVLDARIPVGITKGIKLISGEDLEIRRVVAVRGNRVELDAPIVRAYPHGAEARPLI